MPDFKLDIKILDAYNRTTRKRYVVDATDWATASAIAIDFAQDLDAIIGGEVVFCGLQFDLTGSLAGVKSSPTAGANVDEGITFSAWLDKSPPVKYSLKVPTPLNTYLDAAGNVDLTDTDVDAFLDDFTGAIALEVSDGDTIASFISGSLDSD